MKAYILGTQASLRSLSADLVKAGAPIMRHSIQSYIFRSILFGHAGVVLSTTVLEFKHPRVSYFTVQKACDHQVSCLSNVHS